MRLMGLIGLIILAAFSCGQAEPAFAIRPIQPQETVVAAAIGAANSSGGVKTLVIHPTRYCPVQCGLCVYESAPSPVNPHEAENDGVMSDKTIEKVAEFFIAGDFERLVIEGGGEPFWAFDKLIKIIRKVDALEIYIVTSAYWASDAASIMKVVEVLEQAVVTGSNKKTINLIISVDKYHQEKIPIDYIYNLICFMRTRTSGALRIAMRSLAGDATVAGIVRRLDEDGTLYQRTLVESAPRNQIKQVVATSIGDSIEENIVFGEYAKCEDIELVGGLHMPVIYDHTTWEGRVMQNQDDKPSFDYLPSEIYKTADIKLDFAKKETRMYVLDDGTIVIHPLFKDVLPLGNVEDTDFTAAETAISNDPIYNALEHLDIGVMIGLAEEADLALAEKVNRFREKHFVMREILADPAAAARLREIGALLSAQPELESSAPEIPAVSAAAGQLAEAL